GIDRAALAWSTFKQCKILNRPAAKPGALVALDQPGHRARASPKAAQCDVRFKRGILEGEAVGNEPLRKDVLQFSQFSQFIFVRDPRPEDFRAFLLAEATQA